MNNTDAISSIVRQLLESQKYAVLATDNCGQPYTSLMAFSVTDDLHSILLLTERGRLKYKNLMTNPRVAIFVDNRENIGRDLDDAITISARGLAEEVLGEDGLASKAFCLTRHPDLKAFATSPTCAMIRIRVKSYVVVRRFEEVTEWPIGEA